MRTTILASAIAASAIDSSWGSDGCWPAAMARVHAKFRGQPGTLAHFGDSITVTRVFWGPLYYDPKGIDPDGARALERVRRHQRPECWTKWKGKYYGNDGGTTCRWAYDNVDQWLRKLNPETVHIMLGTNDLYNIPEEEYEFRMRSVVQRCLDNGTVVILSTIPPHSQHLEKSVRLAEIVRRIGAELEVPVVDYFGEILRRRPDDWDGSLPQFASVRGDDYQAPTLIAKDGVHPSNPKAYQTYDEEGLSKNGYILRNWLVLNAYAEVIDMVLDPATDAVRKAVTFYASFDEEVKGDVGGGQLTPDTRFNHETEAGKFVFEKGFDKENFRIAPGKGIAGGALETLSALPRNGRIFFPAKGNLPFKASGWSGAVSFWCNTDPNEIIKAPFCDPVQITQKGANNGGLWFDFNKAKPRDSRHGAFPSVPDGQTPLSEDAADAPMVRIPGINWKAGEWHHVVLNSQNLDTGRPDAVSQLYVDGKLIGEIKGRPIAMNWDLERTGIYVAVNYVGLMDELVLFNRFLTAAEIRLLHERPGLVSGLKPAKSASTPPSAPASEPKTASTSPALDDLERRVTASLAANPPAGDPTRDVLRRDLHKILAARQSAGMAERSLELLLRLPRPDAPPAPPKFPFDAEAAAKYQRDYAAWLGVPVEITNGLGMRLVLVPPGTFVMGSPEDEPGRGGDGRDETQHTVTLTRPLYLGRHEVTHGQFRQFVEATGYRTDGERTGGGNAHDAKAEWKHRPGTHWKNPGYAGPYEQLDDKPVVHVSQSDTEAFCAWLNQKAPASSRSFRYRLPTEAQWEWACRAGSAARYWWGPDEDTTGKVANVGDRTLKRVQPVWPRSVMPMDDGHAFPAPVGTYRANPFGLCDMLGNVWEFCSTRYAAYPRGPVINPEESGIERGYAVRGGGWSNIAADARCATRNADPPHFCHSNLGFRVRLSLPDVDQRK